MLRFACALLVLLLLAGCSPPAPLTVTAITSELTDEGIRPAMWRVPGGEQITLNLSNTGSQVHSWTLLTAPPDIPVKNAPEPRVLVQFSLAPGEKQVVTFRAPAAPGEYGLACSQPGHLAKEGSVRLLVVQPGY